MQHSVKAEVHLKWNHDDIFGLVEDKLYCTALTYDELTLLFYPEYKTRSPDFIKIWKCYENGREY